MEAKCTEVEDLNNRNKMRNMHEEVKEITGHKKGNTTRGNIKTERALFSLKKKRYSVGGKSTLKNAFKTPEEKYLPPQTWKDHLY